MFSLIKKFSRLPGVIQERVGFLWGLNFLYQSGFILSWVIISSLFIQDFGINLLPLLFFGEAFLMLLGSFIGRSFFLKYDDNRFLIGVLIATIIGVISAFFLRNNVNLFFLVAIITKSLVYPQLHIGLLRKIESFFAPTNGRKAIPVIESAETVGTIISAAIIVILLKSFSAEALFSFWIVPLFMILGMLLMETKLLHKIQNFSGNYKLKSKKFPEIFTFERKKEFQNLLVVLIFFQAMAFSIVEFEFMKEVNTDFKRDQEIEISWDSLQASMFSDGVEKVKEFSISTEKFIEKKVDDFSSHDVAHENIAHDLGLLSLIFGLIALVFKLGLTSSITKRFGVFRTMAGYFAIFFAIVTSFVFGKGNWSVIRGYEHGCLSLFKSSYHLSFYSTDSKNRELMRHFLEGVITPLGIMISVGVILVLQKYNILLAYSIIFLLAGTFILSFSLHKKYEGYTLQNFISAKKIEAKIHLLEIIQNFKETSNASSILSRYLKENMDMHPILRAKIIKTLSALEDPTIIHNYLEMLRAPNESEEIKIKILESFLQFKSIKQYCSKKAFTSAHLLDTWQKLFETTKNRHMKKLLIMNIFEHISNDKVVSIFRNVLKEKNEELISICLRSCMNMCDPEIKNDVEPLLKSKNSRIKAHGVMALWETGNKEELQIILKDLLYGKLKQSHIAAIYAIGELKLKQFENQITNFLSTSDKEILVHTIIALLKLGKLSYTQNLLALITGKDEKIAHMAFHMRKRLDSNIREKVEISVQKRVSEKVDFILKESEVKQLSDFHKLSQNTKTFLQRLYSFVGRYENIYILENTK